MSLDTIPILDHSSMRLRLFLTMLAFVGFANVVISGDLQPTDVPAPTMRTLDEIGHGVDRQAAALEATSMQLGQIERLIMDLGMSLGLEADGWAISTVGPVATPIDQAIGNHSSLAFGPDGNPAVAYRGPGAGGLRFARFNGEYWEIEVVDVETGAGRHPSLAFGLDGNPAIAYGSGVDRRLKYARLQDEVWQFTTINPADSDLRGVSLAFDPNGFPAIAAASVLPTSVVKLWRFNGSEWVPSFTINTGGTNHGTSLAFGPNGQPSFTVVEENAFLSILSFDGANWNMGTATLVNFGFFPSPPNWQLAFAPNGEPSVAYMMFSREEVRFVRRVDGVWINQVIGSSPDFPFAGISFTYDSFGNPAVACGTTNGNGVRLIRFNGLEWNSTTVGEPGSSGLFPSLALDPEGMLSMTYTNPATGTLHFARQAALVAP